ncbi:syntaxin-4 [Lepisosteus oculatus]|uniref:Syntaxin 4 n=1 Tax=Lepisosteus oculatus TaxID=7918 RepID=W5M4P4_LEPOC|nr:PREDICTED: syntaxin-4 [Lepisosteus oculatus]
MRDRTRELGDKAESSDEEEEGRPLMIKPGTGKTSQKAAKDENDEFFQKVREIHEGLAALTMKVNSLEVKQRTILGVALPEESMKRDLQALRDEIKMSASHIQKKLKSIEPKKEEEDGKYVPVNVRMQRTQHGILSREFVELMGRCNAVQSQYRDRNVERIQRQLKITGTNVTDEELDQMLESGQTDVFTQNILRDTHATKQALNEIETRHEEILKLERSIRDLHEMFQYLAMEVEAQGEMVNRIESNILQSSNYVEKATADTEKAKEYHVKSQKKKLCIAVCVIVLILVIIAILAGTFAS